MLLPFPVPVVMGHVSFLYTILIARFSVTRIRKQTKIDLTDTFVPDRCVGGFLTSALPGKESFGRWGYT